VLLLAAQEEWCCEKDTFAASLFFGFDPGNLAGYEKMKHSSIWRNQTNTFIS
jgi:hypothetical protein